MNPPQGLMSRRKTQYLSIFLTTRIFSIMSTGMIDILASVLICPHTKIWLCRCITAYDMAWIMLNGQLVRHVIYGKHFLDCGPIFLTSCQEGGNITVDTLFLVKTSSQTALTLLIANQINREGNPMAFPLLLPFLSIVFYNGRDMLQPIKHSIAFLNVSYNL